MKSMWKPSNHKIGNVRAIELRTVCFGQENVEYCLSGPNGEIWEVGGGRYQAIFLEARESKNRRQELLVRFGDSELEGWIAKIGVPENPSDQTQYSNIFER